MLLKCEQFKTECLLQCTNESIILENVIKLQLIIITFLITPSLVLTRADQLLSKLLIEHFDTLPTQCRHIEHMHEGLWFP